MTAVATAADFTALTGKPLQGYAHQCHAASMALVRALAKDGVYSRVARGSRIGVGGQHSWVVLGHDVYDSDVEILDPTWWSYNDEDPYVWSGTAAEADAVPHGAGNIFADYGKPTHAGGRTITLPDEVLAGLSHAARDFLAMLGPLDHRGWMALFNAPVGGWPAAEITEAAAGQRELSALIRIDLVGMLTDRNPSGLYLATDEVDED